MTGFILAVRHPFSIFRPSSWISWAIRKFDKCWANHSAIAVYLEGRLFVMEARSGGMFLSTFNEWIEHRPHKKVWIGKPKFKMPEDIKARIIAKAGTKYDLDGLLFWHPLRIIFGKWWGGTSEEGKFVCSELIGWIYKEEFPEWRYLTTGDIMRSGKVNWLMKI